MKHNSYYLLLPLNFHRSSFVTFLISNEETFKFLYITLIFLYEFSYSIMFPDFKSKNSKFPKSFIFDQYFCIYRQGTYKNAGAVTQLVRHNTSIN
nr:MAG TPA: hypothetical protein [Caudoviricetes sp.]